MLIIMEAVKHGSKAKFLMFSSLLPSVQASVRRFPITDLIQYLTHTQTQWHQAARTLIQNGLS